MSSKIKEVKKEKEKKKKKKKIATLALKPEQSPRGIAMCRLVGVISAQKVLV